MSDDRSQKAVWEKLLRSVDSIPAEVARGVADALKQMTGTRPSAGVAPDAGKAQSGTSGDGDSGSGGGSPQGRGWWGRMSKEQKARVVGFGASLGGTAASIFQTLSDPHLTAQERAIQIAQGAAREAGTGAAALAEKFGVGVAAAGRLGDTVTQGANAFIQAHGQKSAFMSQFTKGGFEDLESLAASGVHIDDDVIKRRSALRAKQADRLYEFKRRTADAAGAAINAEAPDAISQLESGTVDRIKQMLGGLNRTLSGLRDSSDEAVRAMKSQS